MLPGPIIVYRCPHCGGLFPVLTYLSGNSFLSTFYTDGKLEGPMLPDVPEQGKCRNCKGIITIDETARVGQHLFDPKETEWEEGEDTPENRRAVLEAMPLLPMTGTDYIRLIEETNPQGDVLIDLRMKAMWAFNDNQRRKKKQPQPTGKRRRNMEALLELVGDATDHDRLTSANLLRSLGRFDEARELLSAPLKEELAPVAKRFLELIEKGDWGVRKFNGPAEEPCGLH
jgi:hypothetical protein